MSMGMIFLTVVVILFLAIVALPIVGGGICGSVVLIWGVLRKMWNRKVSAQIEERFSQRPHSSLLK